MIGLEDLIANPHRNHPGIAWLASRRRFLAHIAGRAPPFFFDHLEDRPGPWTTVANASNGLTVDSVSVEMIEQRGQHAFTSSQ